MSWLEEYQPDAAHEALRQAVVDALDRLQEQIDAITALQAEAAAYKTAVTQSQDDRTELWRRVRALEGDVATLKLNLRIL